MERLWLVAALAARCSAELSAIAVESAETLTVKKFRARYVRHQLPVIIRPSLNAPNWTHLDFKRMCGAGPITRYEVQPELNQWGGLGVGVPMELDKMIEELYAKNVRTYYGFGFDLKCGCPPFTEKAELLKVFEEDRYKHSEFGKSNWPELIVGSRDSFTALHVDKGMMPFWLKLIEGEKDFRVVPLPEWRGKLDGADDAGAPFVGGPFPSLKAPFDAFDDALVERRWIQERNASVYAGTMEAGDWMYIPVGAFHGAKNNLRTPSVSMSGNYWDKTHRKQILENFCEPMVAEVAAARADHGRAGLGIPGEAAHTTSGFICLDVAGVVADPTEVTKKPPSPATIDAVAFSAAPAAAFYGALPDDASYDDLKAWVQAELSAIWPPGGPQMSHYALDRALANRASSWTPPAPPKKKKAAEL
ncbi:cupin-like domain-containing protein [Aureococcus anophagefferens]|nr:cupin-like domain-containing protein [Aureococcus anophagefferens]